VNDHSILAGIEACRRLGRTDDSFAAFSVGGEGGTIWEALSHGAPLLACAALFPEFVGRIAIDAACHRLSGGQIHGPVETRFEILTAATLPQTYRREGDLWRLRPEVLALMAEARPWRCGPEARGKLVSFILHYPAHDWYRNLSAAMAERAGELGVRFVARNAEDKYAQEIGELRRRLAVAAAAQVGEGETLLLDGGEMSRLIAAELRGRRSLTVVTNGLAVLNTLAVPGGPRVVMTGGEVSAEAGALVGPAVAPMLEMLRVDRAFLSADGISARFGLSCDDGRAAEVARRFVAAARETVIAADHSAVGREARVRICGLDRSQTIITDAGTLPSHRLELSSAGPRVLLAEDETSRPREAVA
jgi:DeoR/GlpR family transcriptional regulator of sugar metabolism